MFAYPPVGEKYFMRMLMKKRKNCKVCKFYQCRGRRSRDKGFVSKPTKGLFALIYLFHCKSPVRDCLRNGYSADFLGCFALYSWFLLRYFNRIFLLIGIVWGIWVCLAALHLTQQTDLSMVSGPPHPLQIVCYGQSIGSVPSVAWAKTSCSEERKLF